MDSRQQADGLGDAIGRSDAGERDGARLRLPRVRELVGLSRVDDLGADAWPERQAGDVDPVDQIRRARDRLGEVVGRGLSFIERHRHPTAHPIQERLVVAIDRVVVHPQPELDLVPYGASSHAETGSRLDPLGDHPPPVVRDDEIFFGDAPVLGARQDVVVHGARARRPQEDVAERGAVAECTETRP